MRGFHDAARAFDPAGCTWSAELADPAGGPIVCRNDVCVSCGLWSTRPVSLTLPRCRSVRPEYAKRRVLWAHIMAGSELAVRANSRQYQTGSGAASSWGENHAW